MDGALLSGWVTGLIVGGVIVLAAASLLLAILAAARRILRLAGEALRSVERIKANTRSIWDIDQTNQTAEGVLRRAQSIGQHGAAVATVLHGSEDESNVA